MAFTYPPTGTGTTGSDTKTTQLITGAPAGWYSPKGFLNQQNNYWDKNYVLLQPYSFSKAFSITDWAVIVKDWTSADSDFTTNGGRVEAAIYNSDANTYAPTTLLSDLSFQSIAASDPNPGQKTFYAKTLATPVALEANKVYWVGLRTAIKTGVSTYKNSGSGCQIQRLLNTGVATGVSFPTGDNNLTWSNGEKAVIYDDANSSLSVGNWAASHTGGLYPFVSWAAADMVTVDAGFAVHLKGSAV